MPSYALFIMGEAPGAIPNGKRIVKSRCEVGDAHPLGSKGKVLSSITVTPEQNVKHGANEQFGYFVEWDSHPGVPCAVMGSKIRAEES